MLLTNAEANNASADVAPATICTSLITSDERKPFALGRFDSASGCANLAQAEAHCDPLHIPIHPIRSHETPRL